MVSDHLVSDAPRLTWIFKKFMTLAMMFIFEFIYRQSHRGMNSKNFENKTEQEYQYFQNSSPPEPWLFTIK